MAEDGIPSFKFRSGLSDKLDAAGDHINAEIAKYMDFEYQAKTRALAPEADVQWDDNVPPDFTDGFDFIL